MPLTRDQRMTQLAKARAAKASNRGLAKKLKRQSKTGSKLTARKVRSKKAKAATAAAKPAKAAKPEKAAKPAKARKAPSAAQLAARAAFAARARGGSMQSQSEKPAKAATVRRPKKVKLRKGQRVQGEGQATSRTMRGNGGSITFQ